MGFKTLFEFTIGFAFGSFACLYLNVLFKGIPEMIRTLKKFGLPDNLK